MEEVNQTHVRCLAGDEVTRVLKEVKALVCGEHQGGFRLVKQLISVSYYWPTMDVARGVQLLFGLVRFREKMKHKPY